MGMRFAGTARHTLYSVAAVLAVVAVAGATFVWCTSGASASAPATPAPDTTLPPPPSTSITTSSTTSSTSTSTSTSTTVKPKPVTTTAKPRTVAPATTPATAPPTTKPAPAASTGATAEERCANARQWVAQQGLTLPAGWGYRCPGQAIVDGAPRWGVACWNCNGDNQSWIGIDIGRIGSSDKALRYVVAHETCHANEYVKLGISTEITADLCAALYGAPRP
jgi:hypothetical protein